jgi:hypothetical protein
LNKRHLGSESHTISKKLKETTKEINNKESDRERKELQLVGLKRGRVA